MNMGKAIRENRLRRNMTQERLASRLNVTAQAVSRWESGQGCPDIALLPELSAVLGVTIDELFACSREQHLERIEAAADELRRLNDRRYEDSRIAELVTVIEQETASLKE